MPPSSSRQRAIRDTADAQAGLITAAQLAEIGVSRSMPSRRTLGGMWTRVLPGVHLVNGGHPTRHQREMAALLYAGAPAALSGLPSLRAYGIRAMRLQETADDIPERPEPTHVLIPHERRRISTGYVRIERTRRFPEDLVRRSGLVLAPLPRSVGDAVRRLRSDSDALAVVTEVVQRNLVSVDELELELALGSMRGSAFLRQAIEAVRLGARSGPEADLGSLLQTGAVPHVFYNAVLVTHFGEYVATPDAWLDDVGLALEVDSVEYHASGEGFAATLRRNARYAAAGVPVLAILPADLRRRPAGVLAQIRAARAAAAARGRADVHVASHESRSAGRVGWRWGA